LNSDSKSIPQSRRGPNTGWNQRKKEPNTRYTPVMGLVNLFSITGSRRKNPSSSLNQLHKCSDLDIWWMAMENRGNSSKDSRLEFGHRCFNAGGNRAGQAGAFVCPLTKASSQLVVALSSRGQEEAADILIIETRVAMVLMYRPDSKVTMSDGKMGRKQCSWMVLMELIAERKGSSLDPTLSQRAGTPWFIRTLSC
jgi:hypothetical protein